MSAPAFALRPVEPADLPFLWELRRSTLREYVEQVWGWEDGEQQRRFFAGLTPERLARTRIVVLEGVDAGALVVERRPDTLYLADIALLPGYQRRGLGTLLIRELLAEAAAAGVPLTLQVLRVNPARRLYERLGLRVTGETPTHWLMAADVITRDGSSRPSGPRAARLPPGE